MSKKRFSKATRIRALEMRGSGCTYNEIHRATTVNAATLSKWEDEYPDFRRSVTGCEKCGLRGEHECMAPLWHFANQRFDPGPG